MHILILQREHYNVMELLPDGYGIINKISCLNPAMHFLKT